MDTGHDGHIQSLRINLNICVSVVSSHCQPLRAGDTINSIPNTGVSAQKPRVRQTYFIDLSLNILSGREGGGRTNIGIVATLSIARVSVGMGDSS